MATEASRLPHATTLLHLPAFACLLLSLLLFLTTACGGSVERIVLVDSAAAEAGSEEDVAPVAQVASVVEAAPIVPPVRLPQPWAAGPSLRTGAAAAPAITGLAAVVVDEASEAVLYDKDAHLSLPPASLTKIATLILALEHGDLDAWVDVDVDSTTMRGSTVMGLQPGDRFILRDLLYGLMLPSGNDAALAIGRFIAGSDEAFVGQMNGLIARLGLTETHFLNPHGLGGGEHRASAIDLALLSRYGMSLPGFHDIVTARSWVAQGSRTIPLGNINTFLGSFTGADGIKTGYTRRAGPTIAVSATRNGHRLYAVVMNSQARDTDARLLLNWAFANHVWPQ